MDYDEWRFGSIESRSSLLKFSPQFIIAPGRMVRMMAMGTKASRLENRLSNGSSIGIPHIRNVVLHQLLQRILYLSRYWQEARSLPILSNMTIMERLCPAFGVCPVPFVKNSGVLNPNTAKEFLQPMKWIYDRPAQAVHEYAQKYRSDIPLRTTELTVVSGTC